jgi:hypothetical protein
VRSVDRRTIRRGPIPVSSAGEGCDFVVVVVVAVAAVAAALCNF